MDMKNNFRQSPSRKQIFVRNVLLLLLLGSLFSVDADAQTIVVKFLNGHNGKPFANERVWVYFSDPKAKEPFDLKTDREGKVQFESNGAKTFEVTGVGLTPCIAQTEQLKNEAHRDYSIQEVLAQGIVTRNDCGHTNLEPQRGQLTIVVRHATSWELFKN
jgi:hypothetical protein